MKKKKKKSSHERKNYAQKQKILRVILKEGRLYYYIGRCRTKEGLDIE